METKPIVGEIVYHDTGEFVPYTDPDEFVKEIESCFYYRGIWGWSFLVSEEYPDLRAEVGKIVLDEFGEL